MEWKDKVSAFKQIDVRGIQGNFFQGLKKQATVTGEKKQEDGTSEYLVLLKKKG